VNRSSISFQTTLEKIQALDTVAKGQHRSRDLLINEALDIYLSLQSHHRLLINNGIRDADMRRLVSQSAVREVSKTWSRT
jgi:predicted transcriptional regulator